MNQIEPNKSSRKGVYIIGSSYNKFDPSKPRAGYWHDGI